tara:strand:- start:1053 stop:1226 length:174 start_codon:yes stop_codon:yes gene_type:complete
MTIRTVTVTVVKPVSFSMELDDSLSVEAQQELILEEADLLRLDDLIIHDCSDESLIE